MLEVQKTLHIFGRTGPLFYGISAVDIALWDIAGKAANAPVCRLLEPDQRQTGLRINLLLKVDRTLCQYDFTRWSDMCLE